MRYLILATTLVILAGIYLTPAAKKPTTELGGAQPTYFAEIDKNNVVLRVIVASQAFIDSGKAGPVKNWVQTTVDGSLRKNYAGKGYKYDKVRDAFIPPKTSSTATLDGATAKWVEPIPAISTAPTTTPL